MTNTGPRPTIAFDFDKSLATYHGDTKTVGEPLEPLLSTLRKHMAAGHRCVIWTARVCPGEHSPEEIKTQTKLVQDWLVKHVGVALPVTALKLPSVSMFYDDKAVSLIPNTGRRVDGRDGDISLT